MVKTTTTFILQNMQVPLLVMRRVVFSKPILNPDYFLILLLKAQKRRTNILENILIGWGLLLSPKFRVIFKNVEKTYPTENWSIHKFRYFLLTFAQVVLLTAITFALYHSFSDNTLPWNTIVIKKGHTGFVILPDSSTVTLNASSILKVSAKYNEDPVIFLDGEGYFKFRQGNSPKALIKVGMAEISGGANTLNVTTYDNNLSIACLEGIVPVKVKYGDKMLLKPGFVLTYSFDNDSWTTVNVDQDIVTSWMQGVYYIDGEKLESICEKIGRVYGADIVFNRPASKHYTFSGKFRKEDPINIILDNLSQAGGIQYVRDEAGVIHWR